MAEECQEQMDLLDQKGRQVTEACQALPVQRENMVPLEDQDLLDFRD